MEKLSKKADFLDYDRINVGDIHEFERQIDRADLNAFAELTGDFNPLHMDKNYGQKTRFGDNIVHGMLVGSLFSALVGMRCPGEKSLYLSQTLNFRQAVFPGDTVRVRGTVVGKSDSTKIITVKTEIFKNNAVVVSGEAKVSFLE